MASKENPAALAGADRAGMSSLDDAEGYTTSEHNRQRAIRFIARRHLLSTAIAAILVGELGLGGRSERHS